jgi:hypothetical protein
MLADATRRQLQRLRFLLEQALSQTQDQTEVGRHSALVLLDGACEYAMGIALGHLGKSIKREFPRKFDDLQAALSGWAPDAWGSVIQLHEARNQVQHHGTVADPSYLPSWAAQAQRFIESLVEAAFGVELRDVLVADSVETEAVRRPLVEAERALEQQDPIAAFAVTISGFDAARETWRGQRSEAIGELRLQASGYAHLSVTETDPTNLSLLRFEDLLETQPFAPDIAEYHWLVARRAEVDEGLAPTLDVARRGFLFVVAWVLRWEAFAARYQARRRAPPPPAYEPPVTGAEHPVLHGAEVEVLHYTGGPRDEPTLDSVRYSVKLTLADIPLEEPELWAQEVTNTLNETLSGHGMSFASYGSVDAYGIVRVHGVTSTTTGSQIRDWVDEALVEGERRYRRKLDELQELASRLPFLREQLADALRAVDAGDLAVSVTSETRDDGTTWLGVELQIDESSDIMLPQVLQDAAISALAGRSEVEYFQSTLWFQPGYDPREAAMLVATVATTFQKQAAARAAGAAAVETRRRELQAELLPDERGRVLV